MANGKTYVQERLDPVTSSGPVFARHESFHPRFGWIKKGFDKASEDSSAFIADDATVQFGIGKNMVKSVRYWCSAFKVVDEFMESGSRARVSVPSDFGSKLLSDNGWDPYLEDVGSLWLLHWNLLKPICSATAWEFAFNHFRYLEFTAEEMLSAITEYKEIEYPAINTAKSSLKSDVNCLIRMYTPQASNNKAVNEDTLDSPFVELGLIKQIGDSKHFAFRVGEKLNLANEILTACCLEYASLTTPEARTINISELTFGIDSPGLIFKLTETDICHALEMVSNKFDELSIAETAGLLQLHFKEEPASLSQVVLNHYYKS